MNANYYKYRKAIVLIFILSFGTILWKYKCNSIRYSIFSATSNGYTDSNNGYTDFNQGYTDSNNEYTDFNRENLIQSFEYSSDFYSQTKSKYCTYTCTCTQVPFSLE